MAMQVLETYAKEASRGRGFVALLSVIVLAAIAGGVSVSLLLLGIGATKNAQALEASMAARALAHTCAELGVQQLVALGSFTGTGAQVLGSGSCTYNVTLPSASVKAIAATGTVGTIVRKTELLFTYPALTLTSWHEVP